jgi:DNA-binding transcriptional LysR family regulator
MKRMLLLTLVFSLIATPTAPAKTPPSFAIWTTKWRAQTDPLKNKLGDDCVKRYGGTADRKIGECFVMGTLWREPIAAVMRDDDVLATQARVAIGDLEGRALIGNPSGSWEDGGGFDLRHAAGEAADGLNIVYLTDQPATLVALVRAAFGIGVISQLALATTPTDGITVRQVDSPTAFRDVALFWNDQGSRNPSLAAFVEAVTSADPPQIAQRLEADEA